MTRGPSGRALDRRDARGARRSLIIGCDAANGTYYQLYSDDRGVCRVYEMSIGDGEWKLWREGEPFTQRFTARFRTTATRSSAAGRRPRTARLRDRLRPDLQQGQVTRAVSPVPNRLPDLGGATAWLNSEPLTPAGLRGKVVLVQFCTYSCVNWLRTLPYVRAWDERYRDDGLVVIGAHSPEFQFEHDVEKVRPALEAMGVDYPIAIDNDFAVWRAFENNVLARALLRGRRGTAAGPPLRRGAATRAPSASSSSCSPRPGSDGVDREPVSVDPAGVEAPADFETLGSPETYVGYARAENLVVPRRRGARRAARVLAIRRRWT